MISIIICSRTAEIDECLKVNIEEHIGNITYEIISIDNSEKKYNIFQAYNIGVQKSQYSILCFMHDDILFHSHDWGLKIVNHFSNNDLGMLGISGPRFLSYIPSIWWGSNAFNNYAPSVCQYSIDTERNTRVSVRQEIQPIDKSQIEVVALDGVFFCVKKNLFNSISFDEVTYGGFHFYDLDISMQIRKAGFKVFAIYDVLIEHISASKLDAEWLRTARVFYGKWKKELPVLTYDLPARERRRLEYGNLKIMADILSSNHVSFTSFFSFEEILYLCKWCFRETFKCMFYRHRS